MIPIRHSPQGVENKKLKEVPPKRGESNRAWLSRVGAKQGILLLGGNSLAHFRIRVAQSQLRSDLLPSFWSLAGILDGPQAFFSVPLELGQDASEVPKWNGIARCRLQDYDDPDRFPNIAVLEMHKLSADLRKNVTKIRQQRAIVDIPSLMIPWLAFIWGAGKQANPLLEGTGLPSAVFLEVICGFNNIDLTPGLSTSSSCPEAIWQSAKWWRNYYEQTAEAAAARDGGFSGYFAIRQREAAAVEHD